MSGEPEPDTRVGLIGTRVFKGRVIVREPRLRGDHGPVPRPRRTPGLHRHRDQGGLPQGRDAMAPRQKHRVRPGSCRARREAVQGCERRVRLPLQRRRTRAAVRVIVAELGADAAATVVVLRRERRARERVRERRGVHDRRSIRIQNRTRRNHGRPHETHRSQPARAVRLPRVHRGAHLRRALADLPDGGGEGEATTRNSSSRQRRDAPVRGEGQRVARAGIAALRQAR